MKLIHSVSFFLLLIILTSCQNKRSYAVLSGHIPNLKNKSIQIRSYHPTEGKYAIGDSLISEIEVDQSGQFQDTIFDLRKGLYSLDLRGDWLVYLQDGYDIHIAMEDDQNSESLLFSGIGSEANNHLIRKEIVYNTIGKSFELDEVPFLNYWDSVKNAHFFLLDSINDADQFVKTEKLDIEYGHIWALYNYRPRHRSHLLDFTFDVSPDFPIQQFYGKTIEDFDYDNVEHYDLSPMYREIMHARIVSGIRKYGRENELPYREAYLQYLEKDTTMHPSLYRDEILRNTRYYSIKDIEETKTLHDHLMTLSNGNKEIDYQLDQQLKKIMAKYQGVQEGKKIVEFDNFENYEGGVTSLSEFRGKYVYIDFWATWCKPCIKEIPHLKKLEEQYHDKNIEFLSISTDRIADKEKWKQMIRTNEMTGVQLFADQSSEFYKSLEIQSLPRFVFIDPNGLIISNDAPRPSNPLIIELFDRANI